MASTTAVPYDATVLFTYEARSQNEMSISKGDNVKVLGIYGEWLFAEAKSGKQGMIPTLYIEALKSRPATTTAAATGASTAAAPEGKFRARAIKAVKGKTPSHLTFNEGDIITIVEQFPTGWWRGELNGRYGLLPKASVAPCNSSDTTPTAATVVAQPQQPANTTPRGTNASVSSNVRASVKMATAQQQPATQQQQQPPSTKKDETPAAAAATVGPVFKKKFMAKANYPYTGTTESELSFAQGDEITIYQDDIPGGWWLGELKGKIGHAPSGYLAKITETTAPPPPPATTAVVTASVAAAPVVATAAAAVTASTTDSSHKRAVSSIPGKTGPAAQTSTTTVVARPSSAGSKAADVFATASSVAAAVEPAKTSEAPAAKEGEEDALPTPPFQAKALFDYAATSEVECNLKEGEEVTVIALAQLGWCTVQKEGKVGHVPRAWIRPVAPTKVTAVATEAATVVAPAVVEAEVKPAETVAVVAAPAMEIVAESEPTVAVPSVEPAAPVEKAKVLYDFQPQGDTQIALKAGDVVTILSKTSGGWWHGELNGASGFFPESYVELIPMETTTDATDATVAAAAATAAAAPVVDVAPKGPTTKTFKMPLVRVKATSNCKAKDETHLAVSKGDVLTVLEMPHGEYWTAEFKGKKGLVPKGSLKILTQEENKEYEDKEQKEQAEKEKAEKEAKEKTEREAREKLEREAKEKAEKAEREGKEKLEREKAEREARERMQKEEQEKREREARLKEQKEREEQLAKMLQQEQQEKAEREKLEREAKEKAEKEAKERAEKEAKEKAAAEQAAKEKATKAVNRTSSSLGASNLINSFAAVSLKPAEQQAGGEQTAVMNNRIETLETEKAQMAKTIKELQGGLDEEMAARRSLESLVIRLQSDLEALQKDLKAGKYAEQPAIAFKDNLRKTGIDLTQ